MASEPEKYGREEESPLETANRFRQWYVEKVLRVIKAERRRDREGKVDTFDVGRAIGGFASP